jgi:septal ring factor EnvC (AmiA/AmiB activator)
VDTRKSKYYLFFAIFLLSLGSVLGQQRPSQDREKLQQKKARLEDEIKLANVILKDMRENQKESVASLEALQQKLRIREQLIRTMKREVELLEKEKSDQDKRIVELEELLNQQQEIYARMIQKAYTSRNKQAVIMFILSSSDFYQAVRRVQYLRQIAAAREAQIDRILQTRADLEAEREELKRKKEETARLIARQQEEQKTLLAEQQEQEKQLADFKGKEQEIQEDIKKKAQQRDQLNAEIQRLIAIEIQRAKEEAQRKEIEKRATQIGLVKGKDFTSKTTNAQLQALIQKKREEIARAQQEAAPKEEPTESLPVLSAENQLLAANFSANRKKLPWPVERGLVVGRFGKHKHAVAEQVVIDNKGIDIATSKGSRARAVFEGEVISILRIPGANKAVLVRHGNYFTVYSNLTDIYVNRGDTVKRGQDLGLIYTDDENGKTILHFEVWENTTVLDPQTWLQ